MKIHGRRHEAPSEIAIRIGGMCNTLNALQSQANHRYSSTLDVRENNLSVALWAAQKLLWQLYDILEEGELL